MIGLEPATPVEILGTINIDASILVDGQSILSLPREWLTIASNKRPQSPRSQKLRLTMEEMACALLIQNLVVYETILVDEPIAKFNNGCRGTIKLFPDIIRPLSMSDLYRKRIVDMLDPVIASIDELSAVGPEVQSAARNVGYLDNEKFHYDKMPRGTLLPALQIADTGRSLLRAHYYLELARQLGLYLSPHPVRSEYFKELSRTYLGTPEKILAFVDQQLLLAEETQFLNTNLEVPAVADLVVRFAMQYKLDFVTAIYEVRNSRNAVAFRKWTTELSSQLRHGKRSFSGAQALRKELEKHCIAWQKDVAELVYYKTRVINLTRIPVIGSILTAFGMERMSIHDPVIWGRKPYLLFLNDLYSMRGGPRLTLTAN